MLIEAALKLHRNVQTFVQQLREGMDRVHRERREHRINRFLKVLGVVLFFCVRQLVVVEKKDVVFLQGRNQFLAPGTILIVHHLAHPRRNGCELFSGAHTDRDQAH